LLREFRRLRDRVAELEHSESRELAVVHRITEIFLSTPDEAMYGEVLAVILEALDSKHGVFGYVDEQGDLVCPSMTREVWTQCQVGDKDIRFPREQWGGIWGEALRTGKSAYSNEPFDVPEGHVPIARTIDAPIVHGGKPIGNLMVANKSIDYDDADLVFLERIADHIAPVLFARLQREQQAVRREQAEAAVQQSEERFQDLVENVFDWVWEVDEDGRYTYVSPLINELLGLKPEEVLGKTPFDLMPPGEAERLADTFARMVAEQRPLVALENINIHKDGRLIVLETSGVPFYDSKGKFKGYRGVDRDVTQRKNMENELRRSRENLEEIVEERTADLQMVINQLRLEVDTREKVQSELSGSEEKFHSLYQVMAESVCLHEVIYNTAGKAIDYRILDVNPKYEEITGLTAEKAAGTLASELYGTGDPPYLELYAKVADSREPTYFETYFPPMDKHFGISVSSPAKGQFATIFTDISPIKKAMQALEEGEARFKAMFENMSNAVATYEAVDDGEDFVFLGFNRSAEKMDGVPRKDLLGKRVTEVFPGVKDLGLFDVFQRVWRTGNSENHPVSFYQDKRLEGWRENFVYKLPSGEVVAIYQDVTDRKRAEIALAGEKERLAVTLRSIGDGLIATDTTGNILLINRVAEQLTGWDREDAVGRQLSEVFRIVNEKTRQPCKSPVEQVLETGNVVGLENHTILIARNGDERVVADSGAPVRDENSEIIGVVLVFRDVTEQIALEEDLQRMQKLESVGVLAGGIAHDFNNLLTAILGYVSLAKLSARPGDRQHDRLEQAEKAAMRARDLTQQLLTFAKGGAPVKKAASLAELTQDAASFALTGSNVGCEFDLAPDLWTIQIDPGQISQVVNNLIINANQAMPEGGIVEVAARNLTVELGHTSPLPAGRYVRLTVKDHGIGIPPDHIPNVFDPYFTTKQKGSGLGLAVCYSIVRAHEGLIFADSNLGEGTTFDVYLPAGEADQLGMDLDEALPLQGSGRILVMDDEEAIRSLAHNMLSFLGYKADCVADGKEAIRLFREAHRAGTSYAAVILDLTVPGGTGGVKTLRTLKTIDPQVKAIVSSGYSNDPVMADFKAHGFLAAVPKPYRVRDLGEAVYSIVMLDS